MEEDKLDGEFINFIIKATELFYSDEELEELQEEIEYTDELLKDLLKEL